MKTKIYVLYLTCDEPPSVHICWLYLCHQEAADIWYFIWTKCLLDGWKVSQTTIWLVDKFPTKMISILLVARQSWKSPRQTFKKGNVLFYGVLDKIRFLLFWHFSGLLLLFSRVNFSCQQRSRWLLKLMGFSQLKGGCISISFADVVTPHVKTFV